MLASNETQTGLPIQLIAALVAPPSVKSGCACGCEWLYDDDALCDCGCGRGYWADEHGCDCGCWAKGLAEDDLDGRSAALSRSVGRPVRVCYPDCVGECRDTGDTTKCRGRWVTYMASAGGRVSDQLGDLGDALGDPVGDVGPVGGLTGGRVGDGRSLGGRSVSASL